MTDSQEFDDIRTIFGFLAAVDRGDVSDLDVLLNDPEKNRAGSVIQALWFAVDHMARWMFKSRQEICQLLIDQVNQAESLGVA